MTGQFKTKENMLYFSLTLILSADNDLVIINFITIEPCERELLRNYSNISLVNPEVRGCHTHFSVMCVKGKNNK